MAPAKTHLMRWAPQDWRTSRVRMRSAMTGDRDLRLVYLEALNALHEHGGVLPSDPAALADLLAIPADVIGAKLPALYELGRNCDGGLVDNGDGTLSNRRIVNDLADEVAFRQQQAELGRRGGRAKAKAKASRSERQANAKRTVSPPAPAPSNVPINQPTHGREEPTRPEPVIVDALTGERRPLFTPSTWIETEAEWRARVSEALKLAQQAGSMHGTDPPDEIARAADYPGAKGRKVDPRSMSHNRLLNTIAALRKRVGVSAADSEPEPFDAFKRAGLA